MTTDTPHRSNPPALRPEQMSSIQAAMQTLDELPPQRPPVTLEKLRALPGMPGLADEHVESTHRRFTRADAVHEWLPPSLDSEKLAHDQATVDRLRRIRQVLEETVDALDGDGAQARR